jgi:hypothetical protein
MSFLSSFRSILHAAQAAAQIAGPVIAAVRPEVGGLMLLATNASIGVEAAITAPGSGELKAALVAAQTKAAIDVTNEILKSQGKSLLSANLAEVIAQQVGVVISGLNAAHNATHTPAVAASAAAA